MTAIEASTLTACFDAVPLAAIQLKKSTAEAAGRAPPKVAALRAPSEAAWRPALRIKLGKLAALRDGWDGPHSKAPARDIIYKVESLLADALQNVPEPRLPFIVPMSDGGIQVEWDRAYAAFEISFFADGDTSALFVDRRTDSETEAEGNASVDLFLRRARWLAAEPSYGGDEQVPPAAALEPIAA